MRLTIIPIDGAVYINGFSYSQLVWNGTPEDIHALQWFENKGWIEFNDGKQNLEITALPDWANNAIEAWNIANKPQQEYIRTAEDNKNIASQLLYETDWATISDVSDPLKSNPYLTNVDSFLEYRNQVRALVLNPVAGNIEFPVKPKASWK